MANKINLLYCVKENKRKYFKHEVVFKVLELSKNKKCQNPHSYYCKFCKNYHITKGNKK